MIPNLARVHPLVTELAQIRHRRTASRQLVAGFAGLNPQTLMRIELGQREPLLDTVSRYAAALGYRLVLAPINQEGNAGQ